MAHPLCQARNRHRWAQGKHGFYCATCGLIEGTVAEIVTPRSRKPATRSAPTPGSKASRQRDNRVRTLLRRDGNRCWICDARFTEENLPTLDHVVPRCEGGPDGLHNLLLACEPCNWERGRDQDPQIDHRTGLPLNDARRWAAGHLVEGCEPTRDEFYRAAVPPTS